MTPPKRKCAAPTALGNGTNRIANLNSHSVPIRGTAVKPGRFPKHVRNPSDRQRGHLQNVRRELSCRRFELPPPVQQGKWGRR
jgi:hypothetical protein